MKDNYGLKLSVRSTLTRWVAEHMARLHNRYQPNQDGKTGFERRRKKNYGKHICEFGETVLFQYSAGIPE